MLVGVFVGCASIVAEIAAQSPPDESPAKPVASPRGAAALTPADVEKIVQRYLQDREVKSSSDSPANAATGKDAKDHEVGRQTDFRVYWNNGAWMETADKAFRFHLGGLIHADMGWWTADQRLMYGADGVGPLNDGAAFRRARLHVLGQMYETVQWTMEVGFENRLPQFFNVYAELPDLPCIGTVRLGHFREPFGMDALTSYNNLTFLERSLTLDPFVPFFNMGTMIYGAVLDQRATYAAGIFRTNSDAFHAADFGDGNYSYTTRFTTAPWYEEDRYALHLGGAASYRVLPRLDATGQPARFGGTRGLMLFTRPEERINVPTFLNTGLIQADHETLLGAEFGLSLGPLLLQGEYAVAALDGALAPRGTVRDAHAFHGFYVQLSYFLTGEHRPYVRREGVFGSVRPFENFFLVRGGGRDGPIHFGRGAWEIAARYSQVDLSDGTVQGGNLRDVTVGLNWYLNPNCRLLINYLLIWRDTAGRASDGLAQAFGTRFQIEF